MAVHWTTRELASHEMAKLRRGRDPAFVVWIEMNQTEGDKDSRDRRVFVEEDATTYADAERIATNYFIKGASSASVYAIMTDGSISPVGDVLGPDE